MKNVVVTRELVQAGQRLTGGWTREQLAIFGVNWPPPKRWMDRVIGRVSVTMEEARRFVGLRWPGEQGQAEEKGPVRAQRVKVSRERAAALAPEIGRAAEERGLLLLAKEMRNRRGVNAYHWMLNTKFGLRVVDYWPTNGKWWCKATEKRGVVADPWEILDVATELHLSFVR